MAFIQLRSAPAEKDLPAPVSTTTRTASLPSRSRSVAVSSAITSALKALCRSGRLSVSVATPRSSISLRIHGSLMRLLLHPEHAVARRRCMAREAVHGGSQRQPEHAARVGGIDDAVIPQPRGSVVGMALALVLLEDRLLEPFLFLGRPLLAARGGAVAPDGGEHGGGLFAAHQRDACIRPHPQEARAIGAAAHGVIAGAERAADDDGELGHRGGGHGVHHLRAILGDAAVLVLAAH